MPVRAESVPDLSVVSRSCACVDVLMLVCMHQTEGHEQLIAKQQFEQKQISIRLAGSITTPTAAAAASAAPAPAPTATAAPVPTATATPVPITVTPASPAPASAPVSGFGSPLPVAAPVNGGSNGSNGHAPQTPAPAPTASPAPVATPAPNAIQNTPSAGAGSKLSALFTAERKRTGVDWESVKIDKFGRVIKDTAPKPAPAAAAAPAPAPVGGSGSGSAAAPAPAPAPAAAAAPSPVVVVRTAEEKKAAAEAIEVTRRHEMKWLAMTKNAKSWNSMSASKIKERARKGIPDGLRGKAWSCMLGAAQVRAAYEKKTGETNTYAKYEAMHDAFLDKEIHKDLDRTYPDHVFFRDPTRTGFTPGRISLYKVLKAYALFDKQVAYCQGMAFPTGLFLMYVSEEDAFWMLHALLQHKHKLHGLYADDIWQTRQCVFQLEMLMKAHLPKLYALINDTEPAIRVDSFATQWL